MRATIINEIVQHYQEVIDSIKSTDANISSDADLEEGSTLDPEDYARQTASGEMHRILEQRIRNAEGVIKRIQKLADHACDSVQEGAIVHTDDQILFVGASTLPFSYEGKRVLGISMESPIYNFIKGKKAGDTVKYGNQVLHIQEVE